MFTGEGSVNTEISASVTHTGEWTCTVTNDQGFDYANQSLTVYCKSYLHRVAPRLFFPGLFFIFFFSFLLIYGGLGVGVGFLELGFWGWGF